MLLNPSSGRLNGMLRWSPRLKPKFKNVRSVRHASTSNPSNDTTLLRPYDHKPIGRCRLVMRENKTLLHTSRRYSRILQKGISKTRGIEGEIIKMTLARGEFFWGRLAVLRRRKCNAALERHVRTGKNDGESFIEASCFALQSLLRPRRTSKDTWPGLQARLETCTLSLLPRVEASS
jgi:hypothetical protein